MKSINWFIGFNEFSFIPKVRYSEFTKYLFYAISCEICLNKEST